MRAKHGVATVPVRIAERPNEEGRLVEADRPKFAAAYRAFLPDTDGGAVRLPLLTKANAPAFRSPENCHNRKVCLFMRWTERRGRLAVG